MISHALVAICMFPLTFVVYWAYGDKVCQSTTLHLLCVYVCFYVSKIGIVNTQVFETIDG